MIDTVTLVNGKPTGYLTTKEFAESIGAAQSTIRVWIRRNKIEALKIGGEWFIKKGTPYPSEKPRGRKSKQNRSELKWISLKGARVVEVSER